MKTSLCPLAVHPHSCLRFCRRLFFVLACLAFSVAQAQTTNYTLGTSTLLEGPTVGSDSVVLAVTPSTGTWTATTNAPWLHLSPANQSGTGSTNVVFSYDSNPGGTRSGTLTIGNQTLTVTQAGSTYVAANPLTTLVSSNLNSPLNGPFGVAVDGAGNVYIASIGDTTIKEWTATDDTLTTLVSSGLGAPFGPYGVAVDGAGNVYIADTHHNAIKEWAVANSNLTTLVSSGLSNPYGVAVDAVRNVYIADTLNLAIKKWTVTTSNVTTLVSSAPQNYHFCVAVDAAGNVYVPNAPNPGQGIAAIQEWTAASSNVTTLVSSGLSHPEGVAVDGVGNVYIADSFAHTIKKWTAASSAVSTLLSSGVGAPAGLAVDGAGNVYIADYDDNAIKELPYTFVDPTSRLEGLAAGNDALPAVLPTTQNLLVPFAPTSDQSWLTITGITNGVVSFSFTANTGPARTAHITLLGQSITITQGLIGTPPTLTGVQVLGNSVIQFAFTNIPGASFTVLSTTNVLVPLTNWTVAGACTNAASNIFQFTSLPTTNDSKRFYTVRSP